MKLKLALGLWVVAAQMVLTSCSTIYFHNGGNTTDKATELSEWHHDGVLGLVEFSDPVDLAGRCEGKSWTIVKVEQTFIQGLAKNVTDSMYDPWEVSYSCK